jgi:hypothetical protein
MAQRQIDLKNLEKGFAWPLGDNVTIHLFSSNEQTIFIKLRREDSKKGCVFSLSVDQWRALMSIKDQVDKWINSVNN